jgi:hypothetical protein
MVALDIYTAAGGIGAAMVIAAYFANQQGWMSSRDWRYPLTNLIGALLILISLYNNWNLPAAVVEGFWFAISAYGLARRDLTRSSN